MAKDLQDEWITRTDPPRFHQACLHRSCVGANQRRDLLAIRLRDRLDAVGKPRNGAAYPGVIVAE